MEEEWKRSVNNAAHLAVGRYYVMSSSRFHCDAGDQCAFINDILCQALPHMNAES